MFRPRILSTMVAALAPSGRGVTRELAEDLGEVRLIGETELRRDLGDTERFVVQKLSGCLDPT